MALTNVPILAAGPDPTQGHPYRFLDSALPTGTVFGYALKVIGLDGANRWFDLGETRANSMTYLLLIRH